MMPPTPPGRFSSENFLSGHMANNMAEKSLTDKLFSKEEVAKINMLLSKEDLTREDALELVNLLAGNEAKLLNYDQTERYIQLKHFAWLGDFATLTELAYDYRAKIDSGKMELSQQSHDLLKENLRYLVFLVKNATRFFLYISRTSNSLNMAAFDGVTKQRFEYDYHQPQNVMPQPSQGGFFGFLRR